MVVDLALEAEGLSAVPLPVSEAAGKERSALLQTCRFRWAEEGLLEMRPAGEGESNDPAGSAGGGAHVLVLSGREPEPVYWAELEERGRELGRRLGEGGERDIVLRWRPLADPGERVVLSWAIQSGAALMMEPVAAYFPGTVRWARPTVVQGTAEELAHLATELGLDGDGRESRRLRKHLRRLRALICLGGEPESEELSTWRSLDVAILHLPSPQTLSPRGLR